MNDYYVYLHREPQTDKIVYVGHGRLERAYLCRANQRTNEHAKWCEHWISEGYVPADWVTIKAQDRGLMKSIAKARELELIHQHRPRFNRNFDYPRKLRDSQAEIRELREQGLFYHQIAEKTGASTMTVWRELNG